MDGYKETEIKIETREKWKFLMALKASLQITLNSHQRSTRCSMNLYLKAFCSSNESSILNSLG